MNSIDHLGIVIVLNFNKEQYVRNDASKMVIQYNPRQETDMSGTSSDFLLRPDNYRDDPLDVEYWVTGKEAENHKEQYFVQI